MTSPTVVPHTQQQVGAASRWVHILVSISIFLNCSLQQRPVQGIVENAKQ